MTQRLIGSLIVALGAALAAFVFWLHLTGYPDADLTPRLPGMDDPYGLKAAAEVTQRSAAAVAIGAMFERFDGRPAEELPGCWPWFRGPDLDGVSREEAPLAEVWPERGPTLLWSIEMGEGFAGAAVRRGRVFVMDYMEDAQMDALRCFSLADGREVWRRGYRLPVKRNHGMSRTVPAVTDEYVLTIGPRCHVMCIAMETGDFLWGIDMQARYGTVEPGWYAGQCPLIDNAHAILAPAGSNVLMTAIDCGTGEVVWETPNPGGWNMSHASITPMTVAGVRMFVYAALGGVAGVAADGPHAGTLLWRTSAWMHPTLAPSPVPLPDGRILLTAGYGAGGMMLRVGRDDAGFAVETIESWKPRAGLASEQHTPILIDGYLLAVLPKDAGANRNELAFCHPDSPTELLWSSGKDDRFGLGPFMAADGKILLMDDNGVLTLARATPAGYERLARAKILDGHESWAPLALAGGRLLARDATRMVCLDLSARP